MTKEEWLKKYYPIPAATCAEGDVAVEHSIHKWEGIAWACENKFPIPIEVSASTCALCHHYYDDESPSNRCYACPLARNLMYPCDAIADEHDELLDRRSSPWYAWADYKDPYPMLNALKDIPPC